MLSRTPEYNVWQMIKKRCFSVTDISYPNYGGRNITICKGWINSFKMFLKDVGKRPSPKHQIDRINNNLHYSCGHCEECISNGWTLNCKWSTREEQGKNKRNNRWFTIDGEALILSDWARKYNIDFHIVLRRLKKHSIKDALTLPILPGNYKLNQNDVLQIRERIKNGENYKYIAQDYKISRSQISCIKLGQKWKTA